MDSNRPNAKGEFEAEVGVEITQIEKKFNGREMKIDETKSHESSSQVYVPVVSGSSLAEPGFSLSTGVGSSGAYADEDALSWINVVEQGIVLDNPDADKENETDKTEHRYIHYRNDKKSDGHSNCSTCSDTKFSSNYIQSSKYNIFTFLPIFLFEQFRRKANIYFLVIACFSLTNLSPDSPFIGFAPLLLVLGISAMKEIFEDVARHKRDREMNGKRVLIWRDQKFQNMTWLDVQVGDVLLIQEDEQFPADMLVLKTSDSRNGVCNVETANLDGETNLKQKQGVPDIYEIQCREDGIDFPAQISGTIQCERASPDLENWRGNFLDLDKTQNVNSSHSHSSRKKRRSRIEEPQSNKIALSISQLLLRGCTLRNTSWVISVVIYTGYETKIMLNNDITVFKRSNVDVIIDKALYIIFGIQFILCSLGAIGNYVWMSDHYQDVWYLRLHDADLVNIAGSSWVTFLVNLSLLVPISLYVSMEFLKLAQAQFIKWDIAMYYEKRNQPALARTSNLNEELGQVNYVFSDKTGTLTMNQMEFLNCSVGGVKYGPGMPKERDDMSSYMFGFKSGIPSYHKDDFRFADPGLVNHLTEHRLNAEKIDQFLTTLSVCHTVLPEFSKCFHGHQIHAMEGCESPINYISMSPDEKALVEAATQNQYYFHHRESAILEIETEDGHLRFPGQRVVINILGAHQYFELFAVLEFNSDRKRMSVIVRDPRDHKFKLYTKGADNVIYDRLNDASKKHDWPTCDVHLNEFSNEGLRTLVCGYRELSDGEFLRWIRKYHAALQDMEQRDEKLIICAADIEHDLTLVGATAIEDRLQNGVSETIKTLLNAGMSVWVLTGDKVQTAINIGKSANLLTPEMFKNGLIVVDVSEQFSESEARQKTANAFLEAWKTVEHDQTNENRAIVINGRALSFLFPHSTDEVKKLVIEGEDDVEAFVVKILLRCKSVLVCRVSPKQKSQMVTLVRKHVPDSITLAIGDGANDVPMIKAAHVGVGISGWEGVQAVNSSDYAIAQFEYLKPLVLVHGARAYAAAALLILYSFYKNVTISFGFVYIAFFNGFSAQEFYDPASKSLFNTVFTAMPIMLATIFNIEYTRRSSFKYPHLYSRGNKNMLFSLKWLGVYLLYGAVQCLIIFGFVAAAFNEPTRPDGKANGLWLIGTVYYTTTIMLVTMVVGAKTATWHWFHWVSLIGSVGLWFLFMFTQSAFYRISPQMFNVSRRLAKDWNFWFTIAISVVLVFLPYILQRIIRRVFFPGLLQVVNEQESGFGEEIPDIEGPQRTAVMIKPVVTTGGLQQVSTATSTFQPEMKSQPKFLHDSINSRPTYRGSFAIRHRMSSYADFQRDSSDIHSTFMAKMSKGFRVLSLTKKKSK